MNKNKLVSILKSVFFSFYWLLVVLIAFDQLTKMLVHTSMNVGDSIVVIPNFFYITYVRNTGAAWSIFANKTVLLALVSLVAGISMLVYRILKAKKMNNIHKMLWAMIIGGTFGNFIDRAFYKAITGETGVVDMFSLYFGQYRFPVFNVADMLLVVGLISLVVVMYFEESKKEKAKKLAEASKISEAGEIQEKSEDESN